MNNVPATIGNANVICYAVTNLLNNSGAKQPLAGFAICQYESEQGYYLFSCDDNWNEFADSFHDSVEEAIDQAEYEYKGISKLFQQLS